MVMVAHMTNDEWGNKWPSRRITGKEIAKAQAEQGSIHWPETYFKDDGSKPALNFDEAVINKTSTVPHDWLTHTSDVAYSPQSGIGWDKATGSDKTTLAKIENNIITKIAELKSQGSNLVDNETYLYFQCEGCGTILDPHTKSFAILQEHRVNAGWSCKWNIDGMGYKVYCAECNDPSQWVKIKEIV